MVHSFIHSPAVSQGLPRAGYRLLSQTHRSICTPEPSGSHTLATFPGVGVLTEVSPGFLGVVQMVASACLGCGLGGVFVEGGWIGIGA